MFDVYFAELRRYRAGAAAFAGVHLVVLAALQKLLELTASPLGVHLTMLFLYLLAGYAFAAFQFGSYRQPSRWIWLLHRPLHRAHILAALVLAAVTLAALAVTLPQMIVLAAQQHYTARVIDTRHYIGALCLSLAALAGWLSGGWIMLHRSRWACLVVVLPLVLCLHMATAATVLVSWLICDGYLLVLLYTVFCPQRHVRPDGAATIPAALMLQVGFYIVLSWSGTWLLNVSQLVPGMQGPEYDRGAGRVYTDAMRLTVSDRLLAGLSTSTAPDAAAWRTALARSPGHAVGPIIRSVAVPGVISNLV